MTDRTFKNKIVSVEIPEGVNIIFGMSHFIKTVEDLYETLVTSSSSIKFGIAFCEASAKRLIRTDGNDPGLIEAAAQAADDVGAGHTFFVFLEDAFPINVLQRVKAVDEVCRIFCATANPLQVLIVETLQGRGVMGVIDGESPVGVESDEDKEERRAFLRTIGYKR